MLVAQLCLTLCDLMACSQPGSFVHGILQARILERVAISFSRGSAWPRNWTHVSCLQADFFFFKPLSHHGSSGVGLVGPIFFISMVAKRSIGYDIINWHSSLTGNIQVVFSFPLAQPAMEETCIRLLGWEDPLEKEMVNHSTILAWKIPWTEEPGRLQFVGLPRIGYDRVTSRLF